MKKTEFRQLKVGDLIKAGDEFWRVAENRLNSTGIPGYCGGVQKQRPRYSTAEH